MVGYPPAAAQITGSKCGHTKMLKDVSWHINKPIYAGNDDQWIGRMVDSQGLPPPASSSTSIFGPQAMGQFLHSFRLLVSLWGFATSHYGLRHGNSQVVANVAPTSFPNPVTEPFFKEL
ncbi:hypothetical protein Plhal304r1_c017g0062931 [Plasmopara halstedii]